MSGTFQALFYGLTILGSANLGYAVLRLAYPNMRTWKNAYKHGLSLILGVSITLLSAVISFGLQFPFGDVGRSYFGLMILLFGGLLIGVLRLQPHLLAPKMADLNLPTDYLKTRAAVKEGKPENSPENVLRQDLLPPPPPPEQRAGRATIKEALHKAIFPRDLLDDEPVQVIDLSLEKTTPPEKDESEKTSKDVVAEKRREREEKRAKMQDELHALEKAAKQEPVKEKHVPYSVYDVVKHSEGKDKEREKLEAKAEKALNALEKKTPKRERAPRKEQRRTHLKKALAEPPKAPQEEESSHQPHRRRYLMFQKSKWSEPRQHGRHGRGREEEKPVVTPPLSEQETKMDVSALLETAESITSLEESSKGKLSLDDVHSSVKDASIPEFKELDEIESLNVTSSKASVPNPKKKCPNCNTLSTKYVLCAHCGVTFCADCAKAVNVREAVDEYTCPNCKTVNKVLKKKPEDVLAQLK